MKTKEEFIAEFNLQNIAPMQQRESVYIFAYDGYKDGYKDGRQSVKFDTRNMPAQTTYTTSYFWGLFKTTKTTNF